MRRLFVGMAMIATMSMPLSAWAGDREIAEQIIAKLKTHRDSGALKDFKVDLKVNDGVVAFNGSVASTTQRNLVIDAAESVAGIKNVVDEMQLPSKAEDAGKSPALVEPQLVKAKPIVQAVPIQSSEPVAKKPTPIRVAETASGFVKPAVDVIVPEAIQPRSATAPVTQLATAVESIENEPAAEKTAAAQQAAPPAVPRRASLPEAEPQPSAGDRDRELNASITRALTLAKNDGRLRGFAMDVTTNTGEVWLQGRTVTGEQREVVLEIVRNVPGVTNVVDDIDVMISEKRPSQPELIRQASDTEPVLGQQPIAAPVPTPLQDLTSVPVQSVPRPAAVVQATPQAAMPAAMQRSPARMMPVPYRPGTMPQPFAATAGGGMVGNPAMGMPGQPMPMQPAAAGMAYGSPRHDQPNMPNYAWPGYSAYPNYAALSYPKQYSPSAWPYIGPFYPYPQVPLNWRKVTLEWDDGWWQLDYSSKSR